MKTLKIMPLMAMVCAALLSLGMRLSVRGDDSWKVPEEARKRKNPSNVADAGLSAAREIYKDQCAKCHGETGKGDGPESFMYKTKPSDFTDARVMNAMTDGEIFYKVSEGRRPMPMFKQRFSEDQRWQLVNFLRTFVAKPDDRNKK